MRRAMAEAVADQTLYIADGHHRYETALNYHAYLTDGAELTNDENAPDDDAAPASPICSVLCG